jgi:hypothetical protein
LVLQLKPTGVRNCESIGGRSWSGTSISVRGDFTRFRTRAITNFQPKSRWQPYASAEALALKGHVIGRYAAGLNYATERGHLFGFGYEFRQDIDKPGSHFLTTLIQFQITGPRKREKPADEEAPE